jgi:hypothetical protein
LIHFVKFESYRAEASRGFAKTLGAFLPLLLGESRGEGKQGIAGTKFRRLQKIFGNRN